MSSDSSEGDWPSLESGKRGLKKLNDFPAQVLLCHALARPKENDLLHQLMRSSQRGQTGVVLRLFLRYIRKEVHRLHLRKTSRSYVKALIFNLIDVLVFRAAATSLAERQAFRLRLEQIHEASFCPTIFSIRRPVVWRIPLQAAVTPETVPEAELNRDSESE